MGEVKNINKGMTYHLNGRKYTKYEALLIYNKYCDKWNLEAEKDIQFKSTKYIFHECMRIYSENNVPVVQ